MNKFVSNITSFFDSTKLLSIFGLSSFATIVYFSDPKITLRQVQVFHRHGDRTPCKYFFDSGQDEASIQTTVLGLNSNLLNKDKSQSSIPQFLNGTFLKNISQQKSSENAQKHDEIIFGDVNPKYDFLGRLTPRGAQQMISLGNQLRQKYIHELKFLPSLLTDNTLDGLLYVRSTNYRRTVYSVDFLLKGLYPLSTRSSLYCTNNNNKENFEEMDFAVKANESKGDFIRTGIPIHVETDSDKEILWERRSSEQFLNLFRDAELSKECLDVESSPNLMRLKSFFAKTTQNQTYIQDILRCMKANKMKNIEGLSNSDYETIFEHFCWQQNFLRNSKEILSIGIGSCLNMISENFKKMKNKSFFQKIPRFSLYSCHDSTLFLIQKALAHNQQIEQPPFASVLIFELYSHKKIFRKKNYYVRITLNDSTLKIPFIEYFKHSGYDDLIPLNEFEKLISEYQQKIN